MIMVKVRITQVYVRTVKTRAYSYRIWYFVYKQIKMDIFYFTGWLSFTQNTRNTTIDCYKVFRATRFRQTVKNQIRS